MYKHHLTTDANGAPLSCMITGATRPDSKFLIPLIDAIPKIKGKVGAPLFRPNAVAADKVYTWKCNIASLGIRGDIHQAFRSLGCTAICHRHLKASL